ncbi:MAG: hypothetical protein VW874_07975 [Gammaproteobacteria bacterium]
MNNRNKILTTVITGLLALVIFTGVLDAKGYEYTEQGIKRGLIAFGIARGLNAIISVAQGTEVAIEPVGVGVTLTPGEILDPINDLIERFSWIVLATSVSLGAQSILLTMTEWLWFGLLVGVMMLTSITAVWYRSLVTDKFRGVLFKATIILVILRLAVPLVAVVNQGIYEVFLEPQYEQSKAELQQTTVELEETTNKPVDEEQPAGFIERTKQLLDDASEAMNIDTQIAELKAIAADISESVLNMIVVFILQTLLFPLLFLWLMYRLILGVARVA